MPAAIPLVGAAFSIAGGVAAAGGMAAIAAGGLSALTLTSGLMIAGGALTGIGAITGNKKLMTLGSVLGLAGGVSSFMSKAGETVATEAATEAAADVAKNEAAKAGASQAANDVAQNISSAAPTAVDTASTVASEAGANALAGSQPGGLINDAVKDFGAEQLGMAGPNASLADAGGGLASSAPQSPLQQQAFMDANTNLAGAGEATPGMGTNMPNSGSMTSTQYDLQQGTYDGGYSGRGPDSIPGSTNAAQPGDWWSKMKQFGSDSAKWVKDNPELAKMGGQAIGGAGLIYGQQAAADAAQKRQMAYQDWVRQRYSDSMRNLTIPSVVRTATASSGIIGGARG